MQTDTALSFAEFSETLEACVKLTKRLPSLAKCYQPLIVSEMTELGSCLHKIDVPRTDKGKRVPICQVDAINDLLSLSHREPQLVRINRDSPPFESWHEAAIDIVVTYHTAVLHCLQGMDDYVRSPSDDFNAACEWLDTQEPVEWDTIVCHLKRERRLFRNGNTSTPNVAAVKQTADVNGVAENHKTKTGVSLRSAAEILAQRGEGSAEVILKKLRKLSHAFNKAGYALKPRNKPLFSVPTMAALIVKCGYADSESDASQDLKTKLEDCRDS